MYPGVPSPVISSIQSSSPAAVELSENISTKIKGKKGESFLHTPGILIYLLITGTTSTAAIALWNDVLKLCFTSIQVAVQFPKSSKEYMAFDLKGKGLWLLQKLIDRQLANDPAMAAEPNTIGPLSIFLPFSTKLQDNYYPALLPVDALQTMNLNFDPSLKHANFAFSTLTIKVMVPVIPLPSRVDSWPVHAWKEDTGFDDYEVETRSDEIVQACYLCNTKGSNANRVSSLSSDELIAMNAVDGRLLLDRWVKGHPFTDLVDDQELVTTAGDRAFPLLESGFNSADSGIRGPIKWKWDSNSGPQTNTILKRYLPELRA